MKLLLLLLQNTVKSTSHLRVKNVIRNKNIHLYNFLLVLIVRYTKYLEIYFFYCQYFNDFKKYHQHTT